jgi:hypothetical protein
VFHLVQHFFFFLDGLILNLAVGFVFNFGRAGFNRIEHIIDPIGHFLADILVLDWNCGETELDAEREVDEGVELGLDWVDFLSSFDVG